MNLQAQLRSLAIGSPVTADDGVTCQAFCLGSDLACYQGHFPGEPVTPAVVEILLAQTVLEDTLGQPLRLRRVEGGEFRRVVKPLERIEVRFNPPVDGLYLVTLTVEDTLAAKFKLAVEPA
ncbi:MAG: hypothetical protein HN380_04035 [Victivallales bacterium]|jgi:3-hydroxyacyl-[acyl-carrier-protein] dehydratase|nr:hypothetical protein [Victivallales bacterium]